MEMAGDRHPPPIEIRDEELEPQTEDDENTTVSNLLLHEPNTEDNWGENMSIGYQYDILDSTGVWCEAEVHY